jgi:transcription elongation factor Elf1
MIKQTSSAGTAHAASSEVTTNVKNSINRVDAFTDFINEWINTNVKVFSRKENNHDGKVL